MTLAEATPELDIARNDRNDRNDRAFLGHPKGLGYLAFTETWERFSYYGMQTLLVLYMVNELLLPGHVENIAASRPSAASTAISTARSSPRPSSAPTPPWSI